MTKQGDPLVACAVETETHLREQGHEVVAKPNAGATAFDIRSEADDVWICLVQAVTDEGFEIVRQNGETLTGVGGPRTMYAMLDRIIHDAARRAA